MQPMQFDSYITNERLYIQNSLYESLNFFSEQYPLLGRLSGFLIAPADVLLELIEYPLSTIECVARVAIHLIGAAFSYKDYTLKYALGYAELAIVRDAALPMVFFMAPIKIAFQFFAILINPKKVHSINYQGPVFNP